MKKKLHILIALLLASVFLFSCNTQTSESESGKENIIEKESSAKDLKNSEIDPKYLLNLRDDDILKAKINIKEFKFTEEIATKKKEDENDLYNEFTIKEENIEGEIKTTSVINVKTGEIIKIVKTPSADEKNFGAFDNKIFYGEKEIYEAKDKMDVLGSSIHVHWLSEYEAAFIVDFYFYVYDTKADEFQLLFNPEAENGVASNKNLADFDDIGRTNRAGVTIDPYWDGICGIDMKNKAFIYTTRQSTETMERTISYYNWETKEEIEIMDTTLTSEGTDAPISKYLSTIFTDDAVYLLIENHFNLNTLGEDVGRQLFKLDLKTKEVLSLATVNNAREEELMRGKYFVFNLDFVDDSKIIIYDPETQEINLILESSGIRRLDQLAEGEIYTKIELEEDEYFLFVSLGN